MISSDQTGEVVDALLMEDKLTGEVVDALFMEDKLENDIEDFKNPGEEHLKLSVLNNVFNKARRVRKKLIAMQDERIKRSPENQKYISDKLDIINNFIENLVKIKHDKAKELKYEVRKLTIKNPDPDNFDNLKTLFPSDRIGIGMFPSKDIPHEVRDEIILARKDLDPWVFMNGLLVTSVTDGVAQSAGVQVGDYIVKINDEEINDDNIAEVWPKIPAMTKKMIYCNEPIDITLRRLDKEPTAGGGKRKKRTIKRKMHHKKTHKKKSKKQNKRSKTYRKRNNKKTHRKY